MSTSRATKPFRKILFNVADISLALSTGGLVLHLFGIFGPIADHGTIPLTWGIGILAGGTMVFVLNGLLMCLLLALLTGNSFMTTLRQGFALSVTARRHAPGAGAALRRRRRVQSRPGPAARRHVVPRVPVGSQRPPPGPRGEPRLLDEAPEPPGVLQPRRRLLDADGPLDGAGALLLLDLDGFKEINDRLGHQVGDSLLQGFAERLEREMPERAFAARLGGDTFAVVIPGAADMQATKALTFDLHARLCRPLMVTGFPLSVSMSIGLAFAPQHAESATDLLAAADIAMSCAAPSHERRALPDQLEQP